MAKTTGMTVYIITYYGQVSSLGFSTEDEAFNWLINYRGVKHLYGYNFEDGYQIKSVNIEVPKEEPRTL